MRLKLLATLASALIILAWSDLPASAEDASRSTDEAGGSAAKAPSSEGAAAHALPADAAPATTGSVGQEEAPIAPELATVGKGLRALLPPPATVEDAAAAAGAGAALAEAQPAKARMTPEEAEEPDLIADRESLRAFYLARSDAPLWVAKSGLTPRALSVMAELARAGDWGLDPKSFPIPDLPAAATGAPELDDAELAKAELTLSLAVLKYARYARGGAIAQPSRQLSSFYDRRPQVMDRATLLETIASADDTGATLASLHPRHPQFELLRQAWLETKRAQDGRALRLPAGPDIEPGDRNPHIAALRKRMGTSLLEGADETLYDERLAEAVRGFQLLAGLKPANGRIDAATKKALAQSKKGNRDQLLANMQAWRYLPADLGDMYVWVNVPEYMIRIVKNGEVIWTERVTTGLVNKQTPIFSDEMERVTFKSKWRVPDSIKVKEVWPSLLSGGGMMRQHGLFLESRTGERVDWQRIDWSKANMEDYTLWQPPGPRNQLGIVKFSFPSKHYVFMHDTPDKHMFNWSRRAVSHGCMRIRNPLDMATIILGNDQGWDRARVDDMVKHGPDHTVVELTRKIPVHITYFTARVGEGGRIESFADVYGHEKRLTQALAGKWDRIAIPADHLAPLDQTKVPAVAARSRKTPRRDDSVLGIMSSALGGI